jgi:hypothetical protein
MAFRRDRLEAIGGFDTQFRTAGDDVDVCWRLQERGWTLGFNTAAMVFHHRRDSIRGYLRQQFGYGNAEALLEHKWPEKYNAAGHLTWRGRVYATSACRRGGPSWGARIAYGTWGAGSFQRLYTPAPRTIDALITSPEWYLVIAALAVLSSLATAWPRLLVATPALALAFGTLLVHATRAGVYAGVSGPSPSLTVRLRALTALLHLLGPAARLAGRIAGGLTPWRHRRVAPTLPWRRSLMVWTDRWAAGSDRLAAIEARIRAQGVAVHRSGTFDRWDLEIRPGNLGAARLLMAVEENPGRTQVVRIRWWPLCSRLGTAVALLLAGLAAAAAVDHSVVAAIVLAAGSLGVIAEIVRECAAAVGVALQAFRQETIATATVAAVGSRRFW